MDPQDAVDLGREALLIATLVSAPILLAGMIVGLVIGLVLGVIGYAWPVLFLGQQADGLALTAQILTLGVQLAASMVLLPRMVGTLMEGLIPVLMHRGGASAVLATDFSDHCTEKLEMVKHYYGAQFEYGSVGLMYNLSHTIPGVGFDLINCSGLLYHVYSPLMILAGLRALVKRNGLVIVSTNVVFDDQPVMYFNTGGRMQPEANTFWYPTIGLLDYLLRYLRLQPVDALYMPHDSIATRLSYLFDKPSGYLSVMCRAVDHEVVDPWMAHSQQASWEYLGLTDWARANAQPRSEITLRVPEQRRSLLEMASSAVVTSPAPIDDSHLLRFDARS